MYTEVREGEYIIGLHCCILCQSFYIFTSAALVSLVDIRNGVISDFIYVIYPIDFSR